MLGYAMKGRSLKENPENKVNEEDFKVNYLGTRMFDTIFHTWYWLSNVGKETRGLKK